MLKTIGGDRLGSGNRMKTAMHNYERSTHNMSSTFRSSMAPGVLVPFYKQLCLNGDTWSIDLESLVRTIPAIGPLLGSYKLQLDMFEVPIRLYNGLLHNNWTAIGMDMAKIKLPQMVVRGKWRDPATLTVQNINTDQISGSALLAYCGVRGIGGVTMNSSSEESIEREFNAIPVLAYYDIFKNYYSNKQEKNAFVIDVETEAAENGKINWVTKLDTGDNGFTWLAAGQPADATLAQQTGRNYAAKHISLVDPNSPYINFFREVRNGDKLKCETTGTIEMSQGYLPKIVVKDSNGNLLVLAEGDLTYTITDDGDIIIKIVSGLQNNTLYNLIAVAYGIVREEVGNLKITEFPLENIDTMRMNLLQSSVMGSPYRFDSTYTQAPYNVPIGVTASGHSKSRYKMVGLCLKTYQSDIFNNWLSSEWIEGLNGISAVTSIDTSNGYFTIDTLNLSKKVYNMLNRIAVSGGTYQDWQEAVYGEDAVRMVESPIYCGGASATIAFEEVVSTADTETESAGDQPLGTLGGKGTIVDFKGGNIDIKVKEPSYIIGIASITPYIDYCQGNDFDMTELESINDLHKPELDQIGFQDLLLERAAYWGTTYNVQNNTWTKNAGGKVPAWIEYMTNVNKVYGDFCELKNLGFMTLCRNYEYGWKTFNGTNRAIPIADYTTYINPTKFNYSFADTSLEAQNFWVQIKINAILRRKISAKIIPNL